MSTATLTLMGTGTSVGVPMIGCDCTVCTSQNPRDRRLRSGVWVRNGDQGFLIDTGPELRLQVVQQRIQRIQGVIYTHSHADHIMGLDDLRMFCYIQQQPISLFCESLVENSIRRTFSYAFTTEQSLHSRPKLEFQRIGTQAFELAGLTVQPLRLKHGHLDILGFRIGDVAFCTDVSEIPDESLEKLQGLKTLVIGAIRHEPHPTHFTVAQAVEVAQQLKAEQTFLTHISHSLPYTETNATLPDGIELAYDGLVVPIHLG